MLELNILISVSSEELLDIFLLFRQEFELSQFVSIVLSFAAEVVSHFGAQGRSVFHFHFSKEFVESPCHFHDTEWCEVLAFPVFESIREDGVSSNQSPRFCRVQRDSVCICLSSDMVR